MQQFAWGIPQQYEHQFGTLQPRAGLKKPPPGELWSIVSIPQNAEVQLLNIAKGSCNVLWGATHMREMVGGMEAYDCCAQDRWWEVWVEGLNRGIQAMVKPEVVQQGLKTLVVIAVSGGGAGCAKERQHLSAWFKSGGGWPGMQRLPAGYNIRYVEMTAEQVAASLR